MRDSVRPPEIVMCAQAVGGLPALARALRITPQALRYWSEVPDRYLLKVERLTGVPRELIRPDLYRTDDVRRALATWASSNECDAALGPAIAERLATAEERAGL